MIIECIRKEQKKIPRNQEDYDNEVFQFKIKPHSA
jgi:hypothetical protein